MKNIFLTYILKPALVLVIPGVIFAGGGNTVFNTKHNLSASGQGAIKSPTETRVCIFCHSSHNASKEGPLWNHETTSPSKFTTYKRSTMDGSAEQPNGATKLCLSCHDGTIAVGAIRRVSRPVPMQQVGGNGEIPAGRKSNLGTDLSGTHPVSVKFQQNAAMTDKNLVWPPNDPENKVGTDADGYVQCTSCHDPHKSRSDEYPFWKKTTFDEVCKACHKY